MASAAIRPFLTKTINMRNANSVFIAKLLSLCFLSFSLITTSEPVIEDMTTYCVDLPEMVIKASDKIQIDTADWIRIAKTVESESGNQPDSGKIAVANVIINRAENRKTSIFNIIYEKGQFDGVRTKAFRREPSDKSLRAAKLALLGVRVIPREVEFFHNSKISTDKKWIRYINQYSYVIIGDHTFCYNPFLVVKFKP